MLELAPTLTLPDEAALQRFAILAMTGAGKSNTAAVMAEEMYDASIPWVAIDPKGDWWGMRSSRSGKGDGLKVPVLGGLHGDVPLEPTAGTLMAETIAAERLTCILDVSEFESKAEQLRFLTDFARTLLRRNRDPLMVFAEEADEYLPQRVMKTEAQCVGAWSRLVKRGRFRGIFCTLITQRSAALNKDALNQIDTLIPMRTTAPRDRKAVEEWVVHHDIGRELLDSLSSLEDGEAWIWSPQKLKLMERIKLRRRRTYDSGETPTLGTERVSAKLANVDLSALHVRMAETIEEQKRNDPTELRKRIRELEAEVSRVGKQKVEPEQVEVEVPVFPEPLKQAIRSMLTGVAMSALDNANDLGKKVEHALDGLDADFDLGIELQEATAPRKSDVTRPTSPPRTEPPKTDADTNGLQLRKGARKMLEILARHYPLKVTRSQLGTLAGFAPKGGTFNTYYGTLKRNGLLVEESKEVLITMEGLDFLGVVPADLTPMTTEERIEMWRERLRAGAREMLDILVVRHPNPVSKTELAEQTGFALSGGTFNTYLGTLRRNGLASTDRTGMVRAGDALFV